MEDGKVISLRLARRGRRRWQSRNRNPVAGRSALVIPFPHKIGTEVFTPHCAASGGLDGAASRRRNRARKTKPLIDGLASNLDEGGELRLAADDGASLGNGVHATQSKAALSFKSSITCFTRTTKAQDHSPMLTPGTSMKKLDTAMQELGGRVTNAMIAEACGVSKQAVTQWRKNDKFDKRHIPTLSRLLGKPMEYWLSDEPAPSRVWRVAEPISNYDATQSKIPETAYRRVPVVGTASLGLDGFWTDLEYPVGHGDGFFDFPTRDREAYAVQVKGNSMFPAIRSGWYVAVEPNKPLQMGEFVLVKLKDGRSTVKEFLWHREGEYVLNAVASGDRLVVRDADIEFVHHIGGILPPSGRLV